jgi:hypothetical protein
MVNPRCVHPFARLISFINRSEYKTPSCELQDLRRGKRYSAGRIGECLEENDAAISFSGYFAA